MFHLNRIHLASLVVTAALLIPPTAFAHISLLEPASRYPSNGNKSCPCGQGDSNRTCNVPAEESSDPNRSTAPEKITVLEAGSTIVIKFDEYIGHSGRYRVAFDADGADLTDFNNQVLADIPDPSDGTGVRDIEVTLPDITCDNCTLQLIQAMHGDTENPVADPAPLSTYYACADIVLVPKGSLENDGSQPDDEDMMDSAGAMTDAGVPAPQAGSDAPEVDMPAPEAGSEPGAGMPAPQAGSDAPGTAMPANPTVDPAQPTPGPETPANDSQGQAAAAPSTESSSGCMVSAQAGGCGLWVLLLAGSAFMLRQRRGHEGT